MSKTISRCVRAIVLHYTISRVFVFSLFLLCVWFAFSSNVVLPVSGQSPVPSSQSNNNVDHLQELTTLEPGKSSEHEFEELGCAQCHIPDLLISSDRRVADLETVYDDEHGIFNNLFGTLFTPHDDASGFPTLKRPANQPFLVRNIFTDFKRHDLGPTSMRGITTGPPERSS
ncbi:MAG: hypothetical protein ACRD6N_20505 [Pyrinomonadaceae bacterium]